MSGITVGSRGPTSLIVTKTADETVNNSSTYQDDDHLKFPIGANEKWYFELVVDLSAPSATSDLKMNWTVPSGASFKWARGDQAAGGTVGSTPTAMVTAGLTQGSTNGEIVTQAVGWITNSTAPGTAQLQWAQNTQTNEDTTLKAGSFLRLTRIA